MHLPHWYHLCSLCKKSRACLCYRPASCWSCIQTSWLSWLSPLLQQSLKNLCCPPAPQRNSILSRPLKVMTWSRGSFQAIRLPPHILVPETIQGLVWMEFLSPQFLEPFVRLVTRLHSEQHIYNTVTERKRLREKWQRGEVTKNMTSWV